MAFMLHNDTLRKPSRTIWPPSASSFLTRPPEDQKPDRDSDISLMEAKAVSLNVPRRLAVHFGIALTFLWRFVGLKSPLSLTQRSQSDRQSFCTRAGLPPTDHLEGPGLLPT